MTPSLPLCHQVPKREWKGAWSPSTHHFHLGRRLRRCPHLHLSINNLGRPGSAKQIPPIHPSSAIWNRARTKGKYLCEERVKDRKVLKWRVLKTGFAPRVTSYGQPTALIPPEASPHKRRLKCDTKHQSQEADATFITSDGSKPYKPWRTLDTDDDDN